MLGIGYYHLHEMQIYITQFVMDENESYLDSFTPVNSAQRIEGQLCRILIYIISWGKLAYFPSARIRFTILISWNPIGICDCTVVRCLTCNWVMFFLHAFNCWVMLDIEMQTDICYTSINWKLSCPFIFTLESSVVIGYPCFNRRKICLFMHDNAFT